MSSNGRRRGLAVMGFTVAAALVAGFCILLGNRSSSQPPNVLPVAEGSPSLPNSASGHCGTIVIAAMTFIANDSPLDAETCFANAFSACRHGELTIFTQGVDAGSTDDLTVSRSGKSCRISDSETSYVLDKTHHQTDHCASASAGSGGLTVFACGGTTNPPWVIPVPSNEPVYATPQEIPSNTGIVGRAQATGCHEAKTWPSNAFPSDEPCPTNQDAFGATIVASRDGNEIAQVIVGLNGRYQLPLPAGEYLISARVPSSTATADTHLVTVSPSSVSEVDVGVDCWSNC